MMPERFRLIKIPEKSEILTLSRKISGMTRWLRIMVDRVTEDTITMPAEAENPPIKTSSASQ